MIVSASVLQWPWPVVLPNEMRLAGCDCEGRGAGFGGCAWEGIAKEGVGAQLDLYTSNQDKTKEKKAGND